MRKCPAFLQVHLLTIVRENMTVELFFTILAYSFTNMKHFWNRIDPKHCRHELLFSYSVTATEKKPLAYWSDDRFIVSHINNISALSLPLQIDCANVVPELNMPASEHVSVLFCCSPWAWTRGSCLWDSISRASLLYTVFYVLTGPQFLMRSENSTACKPHMIREYCRWDYVALTSWYNVQVNQVQVPQKPEKVNALPWYSGSEEAAFVLRIEICSIQLCVLSRW